jgi:streptogrisin D
MSRELTLRRMTAALLSGLALVVLPAFAAVPATAQAQPDVQQLNQIKADLDDQARSSGTIGLSWGVDPATKTVVVSVPESDNDAATKEFLSRARAMDDDVRIERVPAAPRLTLGPGDAIHTGGGRCSASVIGTNGSQNYVVTAGHCTNIGSTWTTGSGETIGNTVASSFPGDDYGLIQVTNPSLPLSNNGLTQVGSPPAGSAIQKAGSTTGVTSGTLVGYGRTVNYAEGTVFDMIETTACVQPGDSGGSLYQGSTAIGITSGGTVGSCGAGFQSFFQPVGEALAAGGLSLL